MTMSRYVKTLLERAQKASQLLNALSTAQKDRALRRMAKAILVEKRFLIKENLKDLKAAKRNRLQGSFIDRLALNEKRVTEMSVSLNAVASLPDPVGEVISRRRRPNGLCVQKVRVPLGVVLIVYEARPNVTSDCAGLLFKTSNVGVLRGGKDAIHSNTALAAILTKALRGAGIGFVPFFVVEKTAHSVVKELLKQDAYIDLVIPRGGEALIRTVVKESRIPVIKHYKGVCHIFVDQGADLKKALAICVNAKVQRPSVCNAVETILIHQGVAKRFLPLLRKEFDRHGVEIRADKKTSAVLGGVRQAREEDWAKEYLDLIISLKVVANVEEAIRHINRYGSRHTDSILTQNPSHVRQFVREVDSACCFVNISTRFSDGFEFGMGAEIGISTDKLHARGPMGLEELTTYKWVVEGNGQIRT
jgi:glutamate-5-semialdehyde dehydrogenase